MFNKVIKHLKAYHSRGKHIKYDSNPADIKVHLGCGDVNLEGFINVDARKLPHVHIVRDGLFLDEFKDGTLEMIYMCHVLEHISHKKVSSYISHYFEKLKKDGVLRLSVPDFDKIIKIYEASGSDWSAIKSPLMGGQGYEFNFHYNIFNYSYLVRLLKDAGFSKVRMWSPEEEEGFYGVDWSSRKIPFEFGDFEISLNVEAIK